MAKESYRIIYDVFIAYHGTDDANGTYEQAKKMRRGAQKIGF